MSDLLLAVDPGSTESGWVILDARNWIVEHGITPNEQMLLMVERWQHAIAIEKIESYGMAVGASTFATCEWSGRFVQAYRHPDAVIRITRRQVKLHLCHSGTAKDSNIHIRLRDLWGPKGRKATPGPTFGMADDMWAALGVAATVRGIEDPLDFSDIVPYSASG